MTEELKPCPAGEEPSMKEIVEALRIWSIVVGIPGSESEAKNRLHQLRNAKQTWIGEQENRTRYAIDNILSGRQCPTN